MGAAAIVLIILASAVVATLVLKWGDRANRTEPAPPEQVEERLEHLRRRRDDR